MYVVAACFSALPCEQSVDHVHHFGIGLTQSVAPAAPVKIVGLLVATLARYTMGCSIGWMLPDP